MTTKRYCPNPILLHLTAATTAPPLDPRVRMDVVRLAMAKFASVRGYWRMALVFYSANESDLKGLLLALQDQNPGEMMDLDPAYYAKSLRDASAAWGDETFLRLAAIAGDVLDWSMSGEWEKYVVPAWDVLCDEVEFEQEERDKDRFFEEEYSWNQRHAHGAYSKHEAQAQGIADARRWARDE